MENKQQISADFYSSGNIGNKKEIKYNMEEHSLSLRKRLSNRGKRGHILPPSLNNDLKHEINMADLEPILNNEQLYILFKNSNDEKNSLGLLFQMLFVENNDNILKYSLANLKKFLISIDQNIFNARNLSAEFNDKSIIFLFELLQKKSNDYYILSNVCFILNKLGIFIIYNGNEYFLNILFDNFNNVLNLAKSIDQNEPHIKSLLYFLTDKIFLGSDQMISKLDKAFPSYIPQIHQEILNLDESKFVKNMNLISTLLHIINNCFYYKIYSNYFFSQFNNDLNEINAENIIKFIQRALKVSYQMDVFEQELRCIQNFLYLFMENNTYFKDKPLKKRIQNIITNLELEKKIIPLIYDNTIEEPILREIALQILINSTYICSKRFCETLIDNNISEQILKLENYLITRTQNTIKAKNIYKLLMDLIYNLIGNESEDIIDNLSIENNCISALFKLEKNPNYSKESKNYMNKIFKVLIQSSHKYIQTLLISEGICEWFKSILEDEPNLENIKMIIGNLMTMVQYSGSLVKENESKNNLLLIHLEKIGILEVVNNLKSKEELSEEIISLINEFCSLFK
jgi:hypothetical protein